MFDIFVCFAPVVFLGKKEKIGSEEHEHRTDTLATSEKISDLLRTNNNEGEPAVRRRALRLRATVVNGQRHL
jgi:hypothetical protein